MKILCRIILYLRFQVYSNTGQIIYSSDKNHKFVPKWRNNPCIWDKTETSNIFCWLLAKHHLALKTFIIESGNNQRGRTVRRHVLAITWNISLARITFNFRRRSRFTVKKSHIQEHKLILVRFRNSYIIVLQTMSFLYLISDSSVRKSHSKWNVGTRKFRVLYERISIWHSSLVSTCYWWIKIIIVASNGVD